MLTLARRDSHNDSKIIWKQATLKAEGHTLLHCSPVVHAGREVERIRAYAQEDMLPEYMSGTTPQNSLWMKQLFQQ